MPDSAKYLLVCVHFLLPRSASPARPHSPCRSPRPRPPHRRPAPVAQRARGRPRRTRGHDPVPAPRPLTGAVPRATGRPTESLTPAAAQGLLRRDVTPLLPGRRRLGRPRHRTARPRPGPHPGDRHRHAGPAGSPWRPTTTTTPPTPAPPSATSGRVRGSTAPLWVGDSDGVEVRVRVRDTAGTARPGAADTAPRSPRACSWNSSTPARSRSSHGRGPRPPCAVAVAPSAGTATPATPRAGRAPDRRPQQAAARLRRQRRPRPARRHRDPRAEQGRRREREHGAS